MKRFTILTFIIAMVLFIYYCAVNPVTGKKELMLISKSGEINLGKELDASMRQEIGIYGSLNMNAYVRRIGESIVPHTHRPNLKYHFSVLDTPVINAFAAPGGYIYVTRGLLAVINSEAELAVILGHELGHVTARHSVKAMTKQIIFGLGLIIASELNEKIKKYAPYAAIAGQLLFLKYSRDNEYQADSLGIEYARKSGYNPGEMVRFFDSLNRETARVGGSKIPNFLSTHPMTNRRIQKVQEQLTQADRGLQVNQNGYMQQLNNMVYGPNPRQGYRRNGYFYHPVMGFKFRTPAGWEYANSPQKVTFASKDGKAVLMLSAENSSKNLMNYSDSIATKLSASSILDQNQTYINGFNSLYKSVLVRSSNSGQETPNPDTQVDMTFIRKGNMIYTFLAMSQSNHFYKYERAFHRTINSFSRVRDPRILQAKPFRIQTRRVVRPRSLVAFLQANRVQKRWYKQVAHLNGLSLNSMLKRNQWIKIIAK